MDKDLKFTEFAPARRSPREEIKKQVRGLCSIPGLQQIVSLLPDIILVLNENRQIIYANKTAQKLNKEGKVEKIFGMRPGELIDCIHACENPAGCGTSLFCSTCGAVRAIISGLRGEEDVQECRIIQDKSGAALDLRVWTFPLQVETHAFTLCVVQDISNEKRRRILERLFFHDIMNTVSSIQTYTDLLASITGENHTEGLHDIPSRLTDLNSRLIEEMNSQRDLMSAENNELVIQSGPVNSLDFLHELCEHEFWHPAPEKTIAVDPLAQNMDFISDKVLLSRVIGNMVKNALEAIDAGRAVTIGCQGTEDKICFRVHNPGFIPTPIQLQIFQRSFSTKGPGRGLGTYSMKLFGEHYLKGKISFTSSKRGGTTFKASFPKKIGQ